MKYLAIPQHPDTIGTSMKDGETLTGTVSAYRAFDSEISFTVKGGETDEVVKIGFSDRLVGDHESLKNGDAIEIKRLGELLDGGIRYKVVSLRAEIERTRERGQKEKEGINQFWYVITGFIVICGALMLAEAGNETPAFILSAGFWILIIYGIGYFAYHMFIKKPNP